MDTVNPDLSEFERAGYGMAYSYGRSAYAAIEAYVSRVVNQETDPRLVPHFALEAMSTHPVVYLSERMTTGIIRRPDLYAVLHDDPRIKAETEEWLWPILPSLLQAYARAFAYGACVVICDWEVEELATRVDTGSGMRNRRLSMHSHYVRAHEVRRDEVEIQRKGDRPIRFNFAGQDYEPNRAHLLLWDDEFGQLRGQGARRRAWRDYCTSLIVEQLECNYLERSVDPPRVARAPSGTIKDSNGNDVPIAHYVNSLVMALRGSGSVTFPMQYDANGNSLYALDLLDVPDREAVWNMAIGRREERIMKSYLGLVGSGAAEAKTLDGMLKEFVQDLAEWAAADLTRIVEVVHRANHPKKVRPPEVEATDVGKTMAKKMLLEVLRSIGGGELGRWVDVSRSLDRLGVPILDAEREPPEAKQGPGRPRDMAGDREERREDADTESGEQDNGDPRAVDRDENQGQPE